MSFEDLLRKYSHRSGDTMLYAVMWHTEAKGCRVAWLKAQASKTAQPAWMLRCECYFTEGVGWKRNDLGMRVSLIGPGYPHTLYAMKQKHAELRRELAHFPSEERIVRLVTQAVRGEFVGEDGQRAGYGIGLATIIAVCGLSPGDTLAVVRSLVAERRLVDLSQDVIGLGSN